jgi:hypothetical protein
MMMAERLAEQAFEMCFSDPPAELAAVKGAPLLAELKPLPGRATLRANGASERPATSENDMKKARIEANRDETQAEEGPEDNIHDPDSGGENRSQF